MKKGESKSVETKKSFFWEAPEFEYRKKDVSWYLVMTVVGIIFIILAVWQKNFLFAVFILIAWFVIVYWASKKPTIWNFKLDEKGVHIILPGEDFGKFYLYNQIEGFDIHEAEEKNKELFFKLKTKFSPYLKILFPAAKETEIVGFLSGFLPREEYEKTASDSFLKLTKF